MLNPNITFETLIALGFNLFDSHAIEVGENSRVYYFYTTDKVGYRKRYPYSWDKSEVIEIAKNQLTSDNLPESTVSYVCNWLESNVKTDIDYQN